MSIDPPGNGPVFGKRRGGKKVPALFLDFDGTLAPIRNDPASVFLTPAQVSLLEDLSFRIPVFVLSGRSFSDLERRLPVEGLSGLSGDHGAVRRFRDGISIHPEAQEAKGALDRWLPDLLSFAAPVQGLRPEIKEFSLSLHYREVPGERVPSLRKALFSLFGGWPDRDRFHIVEGKMVWEIRPNGGVTKEETLDYFLSCLLSDSPPGRSDFVPVMIGDDTTDIGAINRALERGGQGYWVGEAAPLGVAREATLLKDPAAVYGFLRALLDGTGRHSRETGPFPTS